MNKLLYLLPSLLLLSCISTTGDNTNTSIPILIAPPPLLSSDAKRNNTPKKTYNSVITPHPNIILKNDNNYFWCADFQVAWNNVTKLIGEPIHFIKDDSIIKDLNSNPFSNENDIDHSSFAETHGFVKDINIERFEEEVINKFKGEIKSKLSEFLHSTPKNGFIAYSLLFKKLKFSYEFRRDKIYGISFIGSNKRYESFTIDEKSNDYSNVINQISIIDYINDDDFIIELAAKSSSDRLILATLHPKSTFLQTINCVTDRIIKSNPDKFREIDHFCVPILSIDINSKFPKSPENKILKLKNPHFNKIPFMASHSIMFQLNETGAELLSELSAAPACISEIRPRNLIFNKPFLILMQSKGKLRPYFAAWIGNDKYFIPISDFNK